jgi:hypothetical protein
MWGHHINVFKYLFHSNIMPKLSSCVECDLDNLSYESINKLEPHKVMTDDVIYSKLMSEDVHFKLEKLIADELSTWSEITSHNDISDRSNLSNFKLNELLIEIKPLVDNFLKINSDYVPKIDYHNGYIGYVPTIRDNQIVSVVSWTAGISSLAIYDLMPNTLNSLTQNVSELFIYIPTLLACGLGTKFLSNKLLSQVSVSSKKMYAYDHIKDTVLCLDDPKIILASSIGHEYTHRIQRNIFRKEYLTDKLSFFEGHARGVEKFIGETYSKITNNPYYNLSYVNCAIEEFLGVYYDISQRLNLDTSFVDDLVYPFFGKDAESLIADSKLSAPSKHAVGHVFFRVNEEKYGKDVYAKSLRKGFEF